MRAREFMTERQRVDEVLPIVVGGLTALGIGMQGYETYKDIRDYQAGRIDGKELTKRIGTDAAIAVAGGAIGKGVAGLYGAGKAGLNIFTSALKHKDKAKAAINTAKKIKPGSTIQTPKGPRVAGVDGKPTVVDPTKPGARADIKKIKQQSKKQPTAVATKKPGGGKAGAGTAAASNVDDVAKQALRGRNKPRGAKRSGASGSSLVDKAKNFLKKPFVRGAGLASLANVATDDNIFKKVRQAAQGKGAFADEPTTGYLYKGEKDIGKDKVIKIGAKNPSPDKVKLGK